jgi:hypothetical protein
MSGPINVSSLVSSIIRGTSAELGRDVTTIEGFAHDQVEGLARQAKLIAAAIASGQITASEAEGALADLKDTAEDFAAALVGLATVDFEKVWNAAVGALWSAIGTAVGVALPRL